MSLRQSRQRWMWIAFSFSAAAGAATFLACSDDDSSDTPTPPAEGPDASSVIDANVTKPDAEPDAATPVGPKQVTAVAAGSLMACAIRGDGSVWCWGSNDMAGLGVAPSGSDPTCGASHCSKDPKKVPLIDDAQQIAVGQEFGCALRADRSVWCWGRNDFGQLGHAPGASDDADCSIPLVDGGPVLSDGGAVNVACNPTPQKIAFPTNVQIAHISAGPSLVCAKTQGVALDGGAFAGDVYCWGNNGHYTVGLQVPESAIPTPNKISGFANDVVDVALGDTRHACAVKQDGSVWCWGDDYQGRIGALEASGASGTSFHATPVQVKEQVPPVADAGDVGLGTPLGGVKAVRLGDGSSCALKTDGTIWCWGNNSLAALGDNGPYSPFQHPGARKVVGPPAVTTLERRSSTSYAVDGTGAVWGWGDNTFGELANGTTTGVPCFIIGAAAGTGSCVVPPAVSSALNGAATIAGGTNFGVMLKPDRTVWAWGANDQAQLGHAPSTSGDVVCTGLSLTRACNPTPSQVAFP